MGLALGTEVYNVDVATLQGRGIAYTDDELDAALKDPIAGILHDEIGKSELDVMLAGVVTTEFQQENLKEALQLSPPMRSWRIGEGLAEAFLTEHRRCLFPWPSSRDLRNLQASPAGADLVGFEETDNPVNRHRFAFGEVKTSGQEQWPPNLMYGRSGMTRQLEGLRDAKKTKDSLLLYLGHRAQESSWAELYQSAATRYLSNSMDVSLFGLLIRDVEPKAEDLKGRVETLANDCPAATSIELRALYLPLKAIENLPERLAKAMEESSAGN